jgi:hypothetical protein
MRSIVLRCWRGVRKCVSLHCWVCWRDSGNAGVFYWTERVSKTTRSLILTEIGLSSRWQIFLQSWNVKVLSPCLQKATGTFSETAYFISTAKSYFFAVCSVVSSYLIPGSALCQYPLIFPTKNKLLCSHCCYICTYLMFLYLITRKLGGKMHTETERQETTNINTNTNY